MGLNPHGGDHQKPHGSVLDFSVNVHPLGFPKVIHSIVQNEISRLAYYPSIDGKEACGSIAAHVGLTADEVIVGNGAVELIYLYARVQRGKHVCIIGPTFNEYERAFRKAGARISHFALREEDDFAFSPKRFRTFLHENPDCEVIVLCHPNNPTGRGIEGMKEFLALAEDRELLIDESFLDFTELESFLPWIRKSNAFVLRSMTKFYALAGLRIGYGCGSKALIQRLLDEKEPWTINAFALAAIPALLDAKEYHRRVKEWVKNEKQAFYQLLNHEKEWKVYPGQANFLLVRFPFSLVPIRKKLLEQDIYFRICTDFEGLGDHYGRFTIRDREESIALIYKIKEAYDES